MRWLHYMQTRNFDLVRLTRGCKLGSRTGVGNTLVRVSACMKVMITHQVKKGK